MSSTRRTSTLAAVPLLLVAGALVLSGCGDLYMPEADVEKQSAVELAKTVGVPVSKVPPIDCPGDLKAVVGQKMTCVLGKAGARQYDTYITVTRVDKDKEAVFFDIKVADTPRS